MLGFLVLGFRFLVLWLRGFWFPGFKDSWFLGCWFLGLKVSWFLSFKVSKTPWMCLKDWYHITKLPVYVLWNILVSHPRLSRLSSDESSGFFGTRFSKIFIFVMFNMPRFVKIIFLKMRGDFSLNCFRCPGVPKDKNICFFFGGGSGHVQKSRNHRNERVRPPP